MNGWLIVSIYLASCMVASAIFVAVWLGMQISNKVSIDDGEGVIAGLLFMLFWPITIPVLSGATWYKNRESRIKEHARDLISKWGMDRMSPHDRSAMINIPERDLKFLLGNYRKGYLDFGGNNSSKTFVEMLRDELMHRDAERQLLESSDQ